MRRKYVKTLSFVLATITILLMLGFINAWQKLKVVPGGMLGSELLTIRIRKLIKDEKYYRAAWLAEEAVEMIEDRVGPDHEQVVINLCHLTFVYRIRGNFVEAEPFITRIQAFLKRNPGSFKHPLVAQNLSDLATVFFDQNEPELARDFYAFALRAAEHEKRVSIMYYIYDTYSTAGDYETALELCKTALELYEPEQALCWANVEDHPDVKKLKDIRLVLNHEKKSAEL